MAVYLHRDYQTGEVTRYTLRDAAPSVPTPLGSQEPIGPAFAVDLRRAGCGEGVAWESRAVEHPITRQQIQRVTGLVTVTDGWEHNAARVRAVLVAHDPTLPDPLSSATVSAWDLELIGGMLAKPSLAERDQRALLGRLREWYAEQGLNDSDAAAVRDELARPALTDSRTRTIVARVRDRIAAVVAGGG